MFRSRHRDGLHDILDFAGGIGRDPWRFVGFHPRHMGLGLPRHRSFGRRRRGPSVVTLLLAGLAVFAFAKLMSVSNRQRSTTEKVLLGGLLLLVGAILLSFRRSSRRYRL
jgi:hypothetical protein